MLLVAASMTVPALAETTASTTSLNDVTVSGIPTTSPDLTPTPDKKARMAKVKEFAVKQLENNRTTVRCAALFTANNTLPLLAQKINPLKGHKNASCVKVFGRQTSFNIPAYLMHVVTYFLDEYLPKTNTTTTAKIAEFVAKEVSVLGKDTTNLNLKTISLPTTVDVDLAQRIATGALRITLKAGARNQFFVPKDWEISEDLNSIHGQLVLPLLEDAHKNKIEKNSAPLRAVRAYSYILAGKIAAKVAKKITVFAPLLSLSPKCPEKFSNFLLSENGAKLIQNLIGQAIEDTINTGGDIVLNNADGADIKP